MGRNQRRPPPGKPVAWHATVYRRNQPPPAAEKPVWTWKPDAIPSTASKPSSKLARELGVSPTKFALAWTLAQPAMQSVIVGAKRIEQIEEAVSALAVRVPDEQLAKLNAIGPPPWKQMDPLRG